ncbi:MAG TPA: hypothetical protein DEB06_01780 [Phycisphaerales bacterium]|nr:hypothetical protein [Phycisphaerales bacterium]
MEVVDVSSEPRIAEYMELLRSVSRATEPVEVQRQFGRLLLADPALMAVLSVSVRGLEAGQYKVTRFQTREQFGTPWNDPWANWKEIPSHSGGFIGRMIAEPTPKVVRHLLLNRDPVLSDRLAGARSCFVNPLFDEGRALNWSFTFRSEPTGLSSGDAAEAFLRGNIIGRITKTLVLAKQARELNARLTEQLEQIAQIQRSLLPDTLPRIEGLSIASSYLTSNEAGGDYYDFFDMGGGAWGAMVADVSGHGAGAATVMAMLQTILQGYHERGRGPAAMLEHANRQLLAKRIESNFVTAFFGVFDGARRTLRYANAGHNRPLLRRRRGVVEPIDGVSSLPLGIVDDPGYEVGEVALAPGDTLVLYTDGITEAFAPPPGKEMFGDERLAGALSDCSGEPACVIDSIHERLYAHTRSMDRVDDQTLVALRVEE